MCKEKTKKSNNDFDPLALREITEDNHPLGKTIIRSLIVENFIKENDKDYNWKFCEGSFESDVNWIILSFNPMDIKGTTLVSSSGYEFQLAYVFQLRNGLIFISVPYTESDFYTISTASDTLKHYTGDLTDLEQILISHIKEKDI